MSGGSWRGSLRFRVCSVGVTRRCLGGGEEFGEFGFKMTISWFTLNPKPFFTIDGPPIWSDC